MVSETIIRSFIWRACSVEPRIAAVESMKGNLRGQSCSSRVESVNKNTTVYFVKTTSLLSNSVKVEKAYSGMSSSITESYKRRRNLECGPLRTSHTIPQGNRWILNLLNYFHGTVSPELNDWPKCAIKASLIILSRENR